MRPEKEAAAHPADAMLLELAAAEDLADLLPFVSRDRHAIERRIERLQQQLYASMTGTAEGTAIGSGNEGEEGLS